MASYPTSLANLALGKINSTGMANDHPAHHNAMADEINAIEAELGTDPSGSFATVKARLDAAVAPELVTALPGTPTDGQEVYYLADATNGVVWHLRYRAASASAYKWEFVGGPPLFAEVATDETTSSTTYAALATAGPSVTVPLAGDYVVAIGKESSNSGSFNLDWMSFDIGATAAVDADGTVSHSPGANLWDSDHRERRKTGLAAATALVSKYKTAAGTARFRSRWMRVTPVRVG